MGNTNKNQQIRGSLLIMAGEKQTVTEEITRLSALKSVWN